VQGFLVLTREETDVRGGNGGVGATIDLDVGASDESCLLVICAKSVVARVAIEAKQLAARGQALCALPL
jgi:hypothetical protein